jgi:hypothetical protein
MAQFPVSSPWRKDCCSSTYLSSDSDPPVVVHRVRLPQLDQNNGLLAAAYKYGMRLQNPSTTISTSNDVSGCTPILYGHLVDQN